jgi:hypothetical protein
MTKFSLAGGGTLAYMNGTIIHQPRGSE